MAFFSTQNIDDCFDDNVCNPSEVLQVFATEWLQVDLIFSRLEQSSKTFKTLWGSSTNLLISFSLKVP